MGRRATGRVDARTTSSGETVYSIRVPYRGKRPRITLGSDKEGWTEELAEHKLADVMSAIRLGVSLDDLFPADEEPLPVATDSEPTIGELIDSYLADREGQVAEKTLEADKWALRGHIAPVLGHLTPSEVGIDTVDGFRRSKIRERERLRALANAGAPEMEDRTVTRKDGRTVRWRQRRRPLNDAQINRLIDQLATLLDVAIERPDVDLEVNPARGKRRKIKVRQPSSRSFLEPDQVWALLDAARALETEARRKTGSRALPRRAILATLVMGGERISELCDTRRGNLNLGARVLRAGGKTAAGMDRSIDLIFDVLIDILSDHMAATDGDANSYLFAAHGGSRLNPDNVRRMLEETTEAANALARQRGIAELGKVTPHALRRTNISLLVAAGCDPAYVMEQVGHTDPKLTLRIYAQVMKRQRSEEYREKANALLGAATPPVRATKAPEFAADPELSEVRVTSRMRGSNE